MRRLGAGVAGESGSRVAGSGNNGSSEVLPRFLASCGLGSGTIFPRCDPSRAKSAGLTFVVASMGDHSLEPFVRRVPRWPIVLAAVAAVCYLPRPAGALQVGRTWTPMDTTKVPGHTRLYPDRLDVDSEGRPLVFATGAGGIGYNDHVLRW